MDICVEIYLIEISKNKYIYVCGGDMCADQYGQETVWDIKGNASNSIIKTKI